VDAVDNEIAGPLQVRVRKSRRSISRVSTSQGRAHGQPFVLDVSLKFPAGITILFGPSGAGKSTLLDCIAGLLRPDSGSVSIGEEILFDSATAVDVPVYQRNIGYVFQSLALFPHLTVEENVGFRNCSAAARGKEAAHR
jgi:molybdate transport system ATP-binding protein